MSIPWLAKPILNAWFTTVQPILLMQVAACVVGVANGLIEPGSKQKVLKVPSCRSWSFPFWIGRQRRSK